MVFVYGGQGIELHKLGYLVKGLGVNFESRGVLYMFMLACLCVMCVENEHKCIRRLG